MTIGHPRDTKFAMAALICCAVILAGAVVSYITDPALLTHKGSEICTPASGDKPQGHAEKRGRGCGTFFERLTSQAYTGNQQSMEP